MAVLRRAQGSSAFEARWRIRITHARLQTDKLLLQAVASRIVARQTPDAHLITEERKRKNYAEFWNVIPVTEPYRCILAEVRDKLYHTRFARLLAIFVGPAWRSNAAGVLGNMPERDFTCVQGGAAPRAGAPQRERA